MLSRHPDLSVVAVYAVPDTTTGVGDQVMAAVELRPGATFDPAAFARWLADQPDLGTKWAPRFVRVSTELPQTATGKVTKVDLRTERWDTEDEVWWRPGPVGRRLPTPHRRGPDEAGERAGRAAGAGDGMTPITSAPSTSVPAATSSH